MFKCFLFIAFTLYFKGLYTFRLIFDQFHSFMVFNFDNNFRILILKTHMEYSYRSQTHVEDLLRK